MKATLSRRDRALRELEILDTPPEPAFDELTTLAAHVAGTPVALISLVDADRLWFKSHRGTTVQQTPLAGSFCAHVVDDEMPLVVTDARLDQQFAGNPLVVGPPHLRSYAGFPLRTSEGLVLGTLCALDQQPRALTPTQFDMLAILARQAAALLDLRLRTRVRPGRAASVLNLSTDVAAALTTLDEPRGLQTCVDAIVRHLGAAEARIWTLSPDEPVLELQAGAGRGVRLDDAYRRVPVGEAEIGGVAQARRPRLTNGLISAQGSDARTSEPRDGIAAFAGAPLLMNERLLGVVAMFSRHALDDTALDALDVVAKHVSLGVERMRAQEALVRSTTVDTLTRLPNRAVLTERLGRLVDRSIRHPTDVYGVMFIDVDDFKYVNDSLGHAAGDQLLVEAARRLSGAIRASDTILSQGDALAGRFGGDEFVVVLDRVMAPEHALGIADRIQAAMAVPMEIGPHTVTVQCSIGISLSEPSHTEVQDLLREADTAMFHAKAAGKARSVLFDESMHVTARQRLWMENDLRFAVRRQEFDVVYQPIVHLGSGRLVAFEALVRWAHPERGAISPLDFIPLAEETGLIIPIGAVVLERAAAMLEHLSHMPGGHALRMHVNVSKRQLVVPGFRDTIASVLDRISTPRSHLCLEITESAVAEKHVAVREALEHVRALGVQVYLDDFGTGLSSLSVLQTLPIDGIKIDRSFISATDGSPEAITILEAIVSLGHGLGKVIVAEGIEERSQAATVHGLKCDLVQGYLYGRPMSAADAERALLVDYAPLRSAEASGVRRTLRWRTDTPALRADAPPGLGAARPSGVRVRREQPLRRR